MPGDDLRLGLIGAGKRPASAAESAAPIRELTLLRRVGEGDRDAFEQLYRIYYPRLFSYLFRILRQAEVVEETLNDVMMVVWRGADGFRGDSRVSTWIFGIGYRQALKTLRRSKTQPSLLGPENAGEPLDDRSETTRQEREIHLALSAVLERLSPEHRAVVELTFYYGYSYREIASIVGCPPNTVKTRMFHARRKLRTLMPEWRRGEPATSR